MKKIFYLFCLLAAAFAAACTHEEEDLFGDSSANRADAAITADIAVLTGASNGWLMEYFPASMQEYGGYNLLLDFNADGTVQAASEFFNAEDVVTSLYAVKQSSGVVLSFDTYNDIFHLFSDPIDPVGVGGEGFGFEGDYDFLVLEASPEKVVLRGKKAGGIAVLTPMQGDWGDFITAIRESEAAMAFPKYVLVIGEDTVPVSFSYRTMTFTYEENEEQTSQTASYIVTKTGYKFYAPVEVLGVTLSGFTFDAGQGVHGWFTENTNSAIKLIPIVPPLNEQLVGGDWFIAYSKLGSYAQPYFNYVKINALDPMSETLNYAFIGSALYGAFGFNFNSGGYTGLLGLNYTLIGEDQISLQFNMTGPGNGVWYHDNALFPYLLNPFGYSAARTFTLTADDLVNPTYITLTENANTNNAITLSKAMVVDVFAN